MLILLCLTSALRIKNRQDEQEGANQATDQPAPPTNGAIDLTAAEVDLRTDFFAAQESRALYESHIYTLQQSIDNDGGEYYQVTVFRDLDDDNEGRQTDQINFPNEDVNGQIRGRYRNLRDHFDFSTARIYVFSTSFFIILGTEDNACTVRWEQIDSVIGTDDDFVRVNEVFNIMQDRFTVADATFIYYLNDNRDGIDTRDLNVALRVSSGEYRVGSFPLSLRTILIKQPTERELHGTYYSYQFALDLENADLPTVNTDGMLGNLAVHMDAWSDDFLPFHRRDYNIRFDVSPTQNQIDVNLLLNLLDQENTIDQRISSQLGEGQDAPYDTTIDLVAPKGLDTFNHLPVQTAYFNASQEGLTYIYIEPVVPDFSFLPLELVTTSNDCRILYVTSHNVNVRCQGQVTIDGQFFTAAFVKESCRNTYNITLIGEEGSTLSFDQIRAYLLSTMEVQPTSTILTTDPSALQRLARYGITEESTVVENPVIDVSYETYLMYTVRGRYTSDSGLRNRVAFSADFVNFDGSVLSYVRFFFNPSVSTRQFTQFFDIVGPNDSGFESFRILDFQIISVNRDFNTDDITQIRHSNLMVTQDHDILTRNGISIVLETDVDYNCEDNGFCRLLKELDVQTALNFTGIVGNYRTVLTSDFRNFTLNEAADFNDNVFSIVIDQGNEGAIARLSMNGVLDIESEPDRNITFDTTWTFSVEPTENVTISGTRTSIYQDVFERGLFDIIEGRVGGEIDPHSRIIQFDYTSTSVVGNDCYTEQEYVNWVIDDETSPETRVYEYDSMNQNEDGTLDVISDTCRVGNSLFHVYTEDLEQTQYSAQFFFTGYEDFIRVVFNTLPDDAVSTIVDHIRFPRGLTTMQQRNNVVDRDFVRFFGTNNFLGIFAYGEVDAYTHEERVEATMYMPSFVYRITTMVIR